MAGDHPPSIAQWNSGLAAEHRNQGAIEIAIADLLFTIEEEVMHDLTGFGIERRPLVWTHMLPFFNHLSDHHVNRFSERSAGLGHGHIQPTDRILSKPGR